MTDEEYNNYTNDDIDDLFTDSMSLLAAAITLIEFYRVSASGCSSQLSDHFCIKYK